MKKQCLMIAILFSLAFGYAHKWDFDLDTGLFFSQGVYGNDWAGEGVGNISWMGKFYGSAETQPNNRTRFKAARKSDLGQVHRQYRDEAGRLRWAKPDNAGRSEIESVLRFTTKKKTVDPLLLFRSESRFLVENKKGKTELCRLIHLISAIGAAKDVLAKQDAKLDLRLTLTQRLHADKISLQGCEMDEVRWFVIGLIMLTDFGTEFAADYEHDFSRIGGKLKSDLRLYQTLWAVDDKRPLEVNWETDFSVKLWKCIVANFNFALKYDIEEVDKLQWRQMLGLGIGYSLP